MAENLIKSDGLDIDCLPDELLLEVFNYFNGKSLKIIMMTCRRWHLLITQSASTMEKLPFSLNFYMTNPQMERYHNFYSAKIFRVDNLNSMKIINSSLQKLEISYCNFESENLLNLLSYFKQLKYISLRKVQIKDKVLNFVPNEMVLRKFEMTQTDYNVLKILKNFQVINFEMIDAENLCDKDILINFLKSQKLLESLVIEELLAKNQCVLFLGNENDYKFDFKLKKFSASFNSNFTENLSFEKNFQTFMNNQSKYLKELKVNGMLPKIIYKQIVSKSCNNLFLLEIDADKIPQEKIFYEDLKLNNLSTLKIHSTITQENFVGIKEFLRLCKNLKKLFLVDTDNLIANDLYNSISFNLVKLESLSILNFSLNYDPINPIKPLKFFSIRILNNINQWLKFILLNQNLESINVGWMQRDFDDNVIKQIINLTKIKSMKFGGRFIANKRIYDAVKNDYKNLRILELRVSNYDEIKNLKFIFPIDKKLFNPKCLYFEENNDREPLND